MPLKYTHYLFIVALPFAVIFKMYTEGISTKVCALKIYSLFVYSSIAFCSDFGIGEDTCIIHEAWLHVAKMCLK